MRVGTPLPERYGTAVIVNRKFPNLAFQFGKCYNTRVCVYARTLAMKKTLFITMLTAALLGGNTYANTGYAGGELLYGNNICSEHGELVIFEDPNSQFAELGDVYGCLDGSPISHGASVTILGGIVQNAYGGSHFEEVTYQNTVRMSGGTVRQVLCGGYCSNVVHDPNDNTVIVTGGSVGGCIYGGCSGAQEIANVQRNKVYITNLNAGCAPSVIGGSALGLSDLRVWRNEVHLVGEGASILIDGVAYQGHAMTFNHVAGGECLVELSENSVDIYGSGIQAVSLTGTQILNFHLVDGLAAADTPMVSLSGDNPWKSFNMANLTLGIKADAMTDLDLLVGRTVTLVESRLDILGFGEGTYKVVNVSHGGEADAAKALVTLEDEGKSLVIKVLDSSTELLAPGESRQAGSATITAFLQTQPGLLVNLTLGTDIIRGQGQAASMASGLMIDSTEDLLLQGLTLAANNRISVGAHTLTLKDVTITGDWTVAAGSRLNLRENSTITGGVTLEGGSTLDLGGGTFHTGGEGGSQVTFSGDAAVSNGTLVLDSDWSPGYALTFTGITLDLNKHTLSKAVTLVGNNAIGNGTLNTNLNVGEGDTLTLCGTLYGNHDREDKITLGNNAKLDLGGQYLDRFCYVTMKGDAFIGNGSFNSQIVVETDHKLTLSANLWGVGSIVLRNNATLDLNNHSYAGTIYGPDYDDSGTISATIGNGTLDCYLTVGRENTLNLCGDLGGSGAITLKDSATLNLGGHTLSKDVTLTGSATIGGGSLDGNLAVNSEKTLTLSGYLEGSGTISLGDKATLDLGGHALANNVIVDGSNTTITGGGSIKGYITVQTGKSLKLDGDLDRSFHVTLGANSTLDLGSQDRYCTVSVIGNNAAILNGGLMLYMTIAENVNFTLSQDSAEISGYIYLEGNNTLDLGGKTVYNITLGGKSATIGNGTVDKNISMGYDRILTLSDDISIKGGIEMPGFNNTVNLNGHTITGRVTTNRGNNNIGNGTIDGNVIVGSGGRIHLFDETHIKGGTMTFENDPTTIKAVDAEKGGLLKELTVSEGLIAGTDRQTSLADGLDISRMGQDLTLENLVLTANNKISVGNSHSITLNNVTIKLSQAHYDETEGVFLFDLGTLINCDLVMENVLLDASDLILPEGFDPATTSVVFDFGDDVTIQQATGLDMRLGNYWSPSLNLDQQGQVIFTKLVDTPEPTTGVLSLLGLGLLAGRRRRHN